MNEFSAALPHAWGGPVATGTIKSRPEDFVVEEMLGFEPSGDGEHVFLRIEKIGENTDYLARQIAKFAGLPRQSVSYAGMKDRNARTVQWFSVHVPGKREVDWTGLESETVRILEYTRNSRKLKKGSLRGNRFVITVRDLAGRRESLEAALQQVRAEGVPNYFGPQRFGHGGRNLDQALAMFRGELKLRDRNLEGIYLSAARSQVFNAVLARRVGEGNWNRAIAGDVFMFGDSHSFFHEPLSDEIVNRVASLQIHPSGPLWGKGTPATTGKALELETEVAETHREWCEGLERAGMAMSRRALRLAIADLSWSFPDENSVTVAFSLSAGAYATAVLREAVDFQGSLD